MTWRWVILGVIVVALSAAATVAVQLMPEPPAPENRLLDAPDNEVKGPLPLAVIEGDLTHKFGTMAQEDFATHEWVLTNSGEGDLKLTAGDPECSCTIASLKGGQTEVVKPGKSTKVKVRWETRKNNGEYQKGSSILTNDPEHPQIRFVVTGIVRPAIIRAPTEDVIDFANVPNDKDASRSVAIFSPDRPDLKILKVTSRRPDILSVTPVPLSKEDLKTLDTKGGHKLELTIKPGNNLGTFSAEVAVETDHPKMHEMVIPVTGRIVGPISASPESVRVHNVSADMGGGGKTMLTVRGQDETTFEVLSKPEKLDVTVTPINGKTGGPKDVARNRQYVLNVTVPPATEPGQILGSIVLKTSHPRAGQVKIPVDLLVIGRK